MPLLFQSARGRVVQVQDPGVQCEAQIYRLEPRSEISFRVQLSIVTRLTLAHQVNVQFLHTMGAHVFVYVFGDRIGQLTLSGLSFSCVCDRDGEVGPELMLDWYKDNRASKRPDPVKLTLGSTNIEGFVTGFNEDVVDPSTGLVQWGVSMLTLPED